MRLSRKKLLLSEAAVIAMTAVVSYLLPLVRPVSAFITGGAAIGIILVPYIWEYWKMIGEEKEIIKQNKKYENEIEGFFKHRLKMVLSGLGLVKEKATRTEIYQLYIRKNFPKLNQQKINALVLLCLCHHYSKDNAVEFFKDMQLYVNALSLFKVTDQTKPVLAAYNFFFKLRNAVSNIDEVFDFSAISQDEFKTFLNDFINEFSKDAPFNYVRDELLQSEELRKTLLQLIEKGELAAYGITVEAVDKLRKALWEEQRLSESYLVLGNRLKKIKSVFRKHPNLGGTIMWSHVPDIRPSLTAAFVIKPSKYYSSASEFAKQEILPRLRRYKREIFFAIIPLDFLDAEIYTNPKSAEFSSTRMRDCYAALNYFKRGYIDDVALWKTIAGSKIKVEELLSIIPFNIFAPNIVASEREFIIRNYKSLKTTLNIKTLKDWGGISADTIRETILSFGKPNYSELEVREIFGLSDPSKVSKNRVRRRFDQICSAIAENAEKFASAVRSF